VIYDGWYIDDVVWPGWGLIGTDTAAPWSAVWDTTTVADGSYLVRATGVDSLGNAGVDTHRVTIDNTGYWPDMLIRNSGETEYLGNDVYNEDGADQTKAQTVSHGVPAVYDLQVENDRNLPDTFTLTGPGDSPGWTVIYYDALSGGTDITDQVTSPGGWRVENLAAGAFREFRVEVTPEATAPHGTAKDVLVTATSVGDPTKRDVVHASTTVATRYQPDMLIRHAGETEYLGNGVYNVDGADQTKAQTVDSDVTAVYELRVENDGNLPDTITLTGPGDSPGWTVRYYDGDNEIPVPEPGDGWRVVLPPGDFREFRVEVTPDTTVPGSEVKDVLVTATSEGDPMKQDAVQASTTVATRYRPDMLIRNSGETDYLGDGVYNPDGADQTKAQTVNNGVPAVYELQVQNDGNIPDTFTLTGSAGGSGWIVEYYDALSGGARITDQVTRGGWSVPLPPGDSWEFRVEVTPTATAPGNARKDVYVRATSRGNPTKRDTVKASTTCGSRCQPDMQIRNPGEATYTGDGVYNLTGEGQTKEQTVANGVKATYLFKVQNDGNLPDSFTIIGSAGSSGWTVRYYNALSGGTDITDKVTDRVAYPDGWRVDNLAAGASRLFRVEVTPDSAVASGTVKPVLVRATSTRDTTKKDLVQASTTVR
jgi:uncharacterized membrane protein